MTSAPDPRYHRMVISGNINTDEMLLVYCANCGWNRKVRNTSRIHETIFDSWRSHHNDRDRLRQRRSSDGVWRSGTR